MSPLSSRPVSARVLDAAIAWQLCLDGGNGNSGERAEFDTWYAADEEHARAWMQLGMLDQRFKVAPGPARKALLQQRSGTHKRAGIALLLGLALLAGTRVLPMEYWLADQRTATGEQRTLNLADGTVITLNSHSAMDLRFDDKRRLIVLQEGEILVETGHRNNDTRPFLVQTEDGSLRALGTRFLVRREAQGTRLGVLQSAVAAHAQASGGEQILHEGQQVLMRRDGLGPVGTLPVGADAWTHGMLVVDNARLGDLVQELARYRSGHLGVSPQVADLRITGSFPLQNTDLALAALLTTLPVQIKQHTPWWLTVTAKTPTPKAP